MTKEKMQVGSRSLSSRETGTGIIYKSATEYLLNQRRDFVKECVKVEKWNYSGYAFK